MAVTKRLRYEILRRDNHACRYCGATAPDVKLAVDHVTPVALGGSDDPSNLVTACVDCNSGKSSTTPDSRIVEDVDFRAAMWAKARDAVAAGMILRLRDKEEMANHFFDEWESARPNGWCSSDLDADYAESLEQFVRLGVPYEILTDLLHVAMNNSTVSQKWRYFCGCAWTKVRQLNEETSAVINLMEESDGS